MKPYVLVGLLLCGSNTVYAQSAADPLASPVEQDVTLTQASSALERPAGQATSEERAPVVIAQVGEHHRFDVETVTYATANVLQEGAHHLAQIRGVSELDLGLVQRGERNRITVDGRMQAMGAVLGLTQDGVDNVVSFSALASMAASPTAIEVVQTGRFNHLALDFNGFSGHQVDVRQVGASSADMERHNRIDLAFLGAGIHLNLQQEGVNNVLQGQVGAHSTVVVQQMGSNNVAIIQHQ